MFYNPAVVRKHEQSGLFIRSDGLFCRTETGQFVKGYLTQTSRKCTKKPKLYYQVHAEKRWWYVHRLVAEVFCENPNKEAFWLVDHISGDQEDNTSSNLRWCNQTLNSLNRQNVKNYRYDKRWKKYLVSVVVNGKTMMGGSYKTEEDAEKNAKTFKAEVFRALYKKHVKHETQTTRTCQNIHGPKNNSAMVPELPHIDPSWDRPLRTPRFVFCC